MPKPRRAPKHVAFAIITHTFFAQGWRIMEPKAIASLNMLAIMFSGLDHRKEAFAAAAKVTCMKPGSDFERTVMSAIPLKDRIAADRLQSTKDRLSVWVLDSTWYAATVAFFRMTRFLFNY